MMTSLIYSAVTLLLSAIVCPLGNASLAYPPTEKIPVTETVHGTVITDHYRWLEEDSVETTEWMEAQHRFTLSQVDSCPLVKRWSKRLDELCRFDDSTVPSRCMIGDRTFFVARKKEQDRWVYYTRDQADAPAKVILDPNTWAKEKSLDFTSPSRDGRYVAYGISEGGNEDVIVYVLDLETGILLPDALCGWKQTGVCWHPHHEGFFYNAHPLKGEVPEGEEVYWHTAYYHQLGTPSSEDKKVFSSTDKTHYNFASFTEDGCYEVFYRYRHGTKQEVFFRQKGSSEEPTPLATGFDGNYSVEFYKGKIYILTDAGAAMGQIFVTDTTTPERSNWKLLIPERKKSKIVDFGMIEGRLYVNRLENSHARIEIYELDGTYIKDVPLPTMGSASVSGFQEVKPGVRLHFSSFFCPRETFDYDFKTNQLRSIHRTPVQVDTSLFEIKQVWIKSKDGTPVSLFILANKNVVLDRNNPTYLVGYGGFNHSITPDYDARYLVWLEAGGIVAMPNLRGGGEYGREWHEGGMKEKKQNVFDDFIAAAEYLIEEHYTKPDKLAIAGRSNGGLLVGATMTQRPDLFRAVLCEVPLLDMIHYHKWGLAGIWAAEYGSSEDPEAFQYLLKYSPYHHVKEGTHYPATLITTSTNDARVDPCHARKMVARLQEANASPHPILFYLQAAAGHGGGTTLTQAIEHTSHQMAFIIAQLDMSIPECAPLLN